MSLSQRWWRPASPECWCAIIFEMLTTVPVLSVSLTGLPSPNWMHPWRVTSVSLVARERPCRTTGDAHQATSDSTHLGTVIRSVQLPVLWHHAVAAHHWTGWRQSLPRCTSEAMNTSMPSNLCRTRAVMFGLVIQCWWTDWTGASTKGLLLCHIFLYSSGSRWTKTKTEVLDWFFLVDDVTFVVVLVSLGFWTNVTDEPAILSACRMALPCSVALWGLDPGREDFRMEPSSQYSRPEAESQSSWVRRPAVEAEGLMRLRILPRLWRPGPLGWWPISLAATYISDLSVTTLQSRMPPSNPQGRCRWLISLPTPLCLGTYAARSGKMMELYCRWNHSLPKVWVDITRPYEPWADRVLLEKSAWLSDAWKSRSWC